MSNLAIIPRLKTFSTSMRFLKDPMSIIAENLAHYGTSYFFYIGGVYPSIFTADPAFIQHVLQKNHRSYQKSPLHFEHLGHYLGNGLLTSDGDYWLRQRRLIQPGFHRSRLASLTQLMQSVIQESETRFDQLAAQGTFDIAHEMMGTAFRIITRSIFSTNVKEEELEEMSEQITTLQAFIIQLIRQPYLNPWRKLSGQVRKHEQIATKFDETILGYIHARKSSGEYRDDLLQMLLDSRYEDTGEPMSEQALLDEVKILFVAGHETSANALAWSWYLLSQHPEVVAKIRAELDEVAPDRSLEFEDLGKLEYLTQVIEEVLRLYPPAWITDRQAAKDDEFNGIKIKKGTFLVTYIYGVHHSADYWEDPEAFRPERFAKGHKLEHPYAYIPFGGGPRLCIGNHFAHMEMQLVIANLIRRYDFELDADHLVEKQPLITLRPRYGIKMRFWRRDNLLA
jgi:cytochrome P450